MKIKSVTIKNYKCFENEKINLAVPNGKKASGLTILVGENNSGKTSFFSIFNKLKQGASIYSLERRGKKNSEIIFVDNNDLEKVIKNTSNSSNIEISGESQLNYDKVDIIKDNKFWKGKVQQAASYSHSIYRSHSNDSREGIDNYLSSGLATLIGTEDKEIFDKLIQKIIPGFRSWTIDADDPQTGTYIKYSVSKNDDMRIDYSVGSGILSVFRIIYTLVDKTEKIILIDEPESFLHPIAQQNLLRILEEESKNRQVVFSTHSPFMFRGVSKNASFISFKNNKKTGVTKTTDIKMFALPSGPTFGEVNYFVYNLPTEEFHSELYGYLEYLYKENFHTSGKYDFDTFLSKKDSKETNKTKKWKNSLRNCKEDTVTLHSYIRHSIHHPENSCGNKKYTQAELKRSIKQMLKVLKDIQK